MVKLSLKNVSILFLMTFILFPVTIFLNFFILNKDSSCSPQSPIKHQAWNSHKSFQSNRNHLAVIVPFRERLNQLLQFIPHMDSFLDRQNISHEFFIINQVDKYRFNRGALINVGFKLAKNSNSTYIAMHDVDLLPLNDQLSYGFPSEGPFHVSSPKLHPKYHYKTYVGGILLIQNKHFELVNGFSTNYFGWGLEDDEFYVRLKEANLRICRPENITTDKSSTFAHIHDQSIYKRDTAKLFNQRKVTRKRDRQTGLNTTKFELLAVHYLTLKDVNFRIFDVALHCNIEKTPWYYELVEPKIEYLNFDHLKIDLTAFNKNFTIDLKKNYFISENYQELPNLSYHNGKQRKKHCHYKGNVNGQIDSSFAAISFCDKLLNGIFVVDGIEYNLQQSPQSTSFDNNQNGKVKIFTTKSDLNKYLCGFNQTVLSNTLRKKRDIKDNGNLFQIQRYVEMVIVNDLKLYEKYKENLHFLFERNVQIANIVNSLYSPFNISIILVGVVIWAERNEIIISNSSETLNNFLKYRRDILIQKFPNDNAQLITASQFENGIVGKALKQTMCTYEYSGGVNYDYHESISLIATTIAHELGHNFGMEHDHDGCQCEANNCIMGPSSSLPHPRHWSICSINQLKESLQHGLDYCLMNKPKVIFRPSCGNGFIDEGEECDCGLPGFCTNKCCNATSCKLMSHAKCAVGDCCDKNTCTIISRHSKFICRQAKSICDKAEKCDGISEHCPKDKFVHDGTECQEGYAYCFNGKCETRENRCHLLWGNESQVASYRCYQNNANANSSGNCGYDKRTKAFIKCQSKEDIICGRLHCSNHNINQKLTLKYGPEGSTVISQIIETHLESIICLSAVVDLGLDDDVGLVPNGAKCGLNSMCVHQKCVQVPSSIQQCDDNNDDTCILPSTSSLLIFIYIFFSILPLVFSIIYFFFYKNKRIPKNWFGQKAFIARDYNNRRLKNPINPHISIPIETELSIKPVRPAPPPPPPPHATRENTRVKKQIQTDDKNTMKNNHLQQKSNIKSPSSLPIQSSSKEKFPTVKDLVAAFEKN